MTQFVSFISLVTFLTNINAITIIQTPLGQIKANRIVTTTGIEIIESLNIPFATPPIAALRFATPQTIKPWKSIIDGTKFGPACSQVNATLPYISEDCLTLNIWKPTGLTSNQTTLLPVLVWVFGGGLTSGSGIQYNGTKLAALGNVVIVTINYRLGALGLYASKAISNEKINHQSNGAMNSVADVIESLKFVQKYISYFGGDPTQVTVAGESSGSMNSCILAFSKQAKHLFHRLILESGACTGPWIGPNWRKKSALNVSHIFAQTVLHNYYSSNATKIENKKDKDQEGEEDEDTKTLARLRQMPVSVLLNSTTFDSLNYGIDGYIMNERPRDNTLLFEGDVLLGGNTGDTTCRSVGAVPITPTNEIDLLNVLTTYFGKEDANYVAAPYLQTYTKGSNSNETTTFKDIGELFYSMSRDAGVTCPTLRLARRMTSSLKHGNVYLYQFGYNSTSNNGIVNHGGELNAVWQNYTFGESTQHTSSFVEQVVGEYWTSFISNGKPIVSDDVSANVSIWNNFEGGGTGDDESFQFFAGDGSIQNTPFSMNDASHCSHWDSYIQKGANEQKNVDAFGYLC